MAVRKLERLPGHLLAMRYEQDTIQFFDSTAGPAFQQALVEYNTRLAEVGAPKDPVRAVQLYMLVRAANKLAPGDYAEMGTHLGISLKLIHTFMDHKRQLYSFDTFAGFDARDLPAEHSRGFTRWEAGSFSPTSPETVSRYLGRPRNVTFVKGYFPDTWFGFENHSWRFVHLDLDLYLPTLNALERVWDGLVPGGIVLVHDYGDGGFATPQAVDSFCQQRGIWPVELADYHGSVVLRKP